MTKVELQIKSNPLVLETGRFARQADGSVVATYGDTVILATAVAKKEAREGIDFFPLTIDYQEKAYAAGKIPGGFFKREGRLGIKETLVSRLIDRPIRPLFPDGFYSETQGIVTVLSFGDENISDLLGIIGVSTALSISNIPFNCPVGAVRICIIGNILVVNPDLKEIEECEFTLIAAGTEEAILMVEGGGIEISEELLLEALNLAHKEIMPIIELQKKLVSMIGKDKRPVTPPKTDEELLKRVSDLSINRIKESIVISDKLSRQDSLDQILKDVITELNSEEEDISRDIASGFNRIEKNLVRNMILETGLRTDGRKSDEIREINSHVGILPRTHGSALFVRGETQALVVVTLGTADDEQRIDALEGDSRKAFMLHYNFPPLALARLSSCGEPVGER